MTFTPLMRRPHTTSVRTPRWGGLRLSGELAYLCPVTAGDEVTVRFFAGARAAAGCDQVTVEPGPLEKVIEGLHTSFPALAAVTPVCSYLVNGLSVKRPQDPVVRAGSSLDVLPPFAGG